MNQTSHTEVAIVGAGIIGLAIAYAEARRGRRVTVFERDHQAMGASIRNFGMIWPIGQAATQPLYRALQSRAIWAGVAREAGFWFAETGSLHLAYQPDELAVLEEFMTDANPKGYSVKMLTPSETISKSPAVNQTGLLGAMWSATEMLVDPREVPGKLSSYLTEKYKVNFRFGTAVTHIDEHRLQAVNTSMTFDRCYVCSGADLETLFPTSFQHTGLTKVKLQMMRTAPQPNGWRMGPSLAAGLTLTHYASFAHCKSLAALKDRIEAESPWFNEWGIHVMMSQNGKGELIIGDSHEYGPSHSPFINERINQYILDYLQGFVRVPQLEIENRWFGIYTKLPGQTEFIADPLPHVKIVTGLSGAGMSLSFGLAEEIVGKRD